LEGIKSREGLLMPNWENSTRKSRLPSNWEQIRREVLCRDEHRCTRCDIEGRHCSRCGKGSRRSRVTLEVDHRQAGDDHSADNLRTLCADCHKRKSSREGQRAYWAAVNRSKKKFRRVEEHPGYLRRR